MISNQATPYASRPHRYCFTKPVTIILPYDSYPLPSGPRMPLSWYSGTEVTVMRAYNSSDWDFRVLKGATFQDGFAFLQVPPPHIRVYGLSVQGRRM